MSLDITSGSGTWFGPSSLMTGITAFPFSIAYWVRDTAQNGRYSFTFRDSVDTGYYTGDYFQAGTTAGQVKYRHSRASGGSVDGFTDDDAFADDTWAHVAIIYNASNDVDFYINGSLGGTDTGTRNIVGGTNGLNELILAANPSNNYSGLIAEFSIWNSEAITTGNITDLQTKTADNISNNPEFYWPLETDGTATLGSNNIVAKNSATGTYSDANHPTLTGPGGGGGGIAGSVAHYNQKLRKAS